MRHVVILATCHHAQTGNCSVSFIYSLIALINIYLSLTLEQCRAEFGAIFTDQTTNVSVRLQRIFKEKRGKL